MQNIDAINLERKIIDSKTVKSRYKLGSTVFEVTSVFNGNKRYSDILYEIACEKIKRSSI
jgi:hypothetical protein